MYVVLIMEEKKKINLQFCIYKSILVPFSFSVRKSKVATLVKTFVEIC